MKTSRVVVALAILLTGVPVSAQVGAPPDQPRNFSVTMPETGYPQKEMMVTGRITGIDLANGTVTLDNGTEFTLPPSLQYTSFPALGQEVDVRYDDQGGRHVAKSFEQGGRGGPAE